jgi:hypothetical protein
MKALKIILAVAVMATIGFFIWKWIINIEQPTDVKPPTNPYTARIEREIDSLRKVPVNTFCKQFCENIQYRITDYYKQKFLGKTDKDNERWKDILSKNLYSTYAPKFTEQAMYVFNHSDWKIADLTFIRNEVKKLQGSGYLEQNSPVASKFKDIQIILSKYDEIVGFISSCKGYSYSNYEIDGLFPIDDVSGKIQKSKTYLSNRLDNNYVNNCTRLKDGLREIPQTLYNKHISYLRLKIQKNSGRYKEYQFQKDYSNIIYTPLESQVNELDNNIYGINTDIFDGNLSDLKKLLDTDNTNAYDYFHPR